MDGILLTDAPTPTVNLREETANIVKANIRQLLVDVLSEKVGHAMAVAAGATFWRETFVRNMGAFWGNNRGEADNVADSVFRFLETAWRKQYPDQNATAFLDAVHVPSPESEHERERAIEDAWEVEIAGSEEAMERHYHGSARVRKGRDIFSSFWQKTPDKVQ